MPTYDFDWIDAFTENRFGGNACVVVHNAADVSVEARTALVRETSLSECAYLVGSDVADFGARYYLAEREILMAGHPTIATVASLIERGLVKPSPDGTAFTLEVGAGVLPIVATSREGRAPLIMMTQMAAKFGRVYDAAEIAAMYGLAPEDIVHPPQIASTGTPFCVAVLKDHDALRRAVLNRDHLMSWREQSDFEGAAVMEPFLVTLKGASDEGDTYSRLLLPPPMPAEDPFTGSATGAMAAYLWHHGLIQTPRFIAEQGHWMGRPGQATVEVLGPPEAIRGVNVSGCGVRLMSGQVSL
ncbi:MAG: PhzF family phenazine biosynthesis protein [Pseudomonadota bacterium]